MYFLEKVEVTDADNPEAAKVEADDGPELFVHGLESGN
jgi:hypothetical protein